MTLIKWICFILLCGDAYAYVYYTVKKGNPTLGISIGLILGIMARVYALYGLATCWLLK